MRTTTVTLLPNQSTPEEACYATGPLPVYVKYARLPLRGEWNSLGAESESRGQSRGPTPALVREEGQGRASTNESTPLEARHKSSPLDVATSIAHTMLAYSLVSSHGAIPETTEL